MKATNHSTRLPLFSRLPFAKLYARYEQQPRISSVERVEELSGETFRSQVLPRHYPVIVNALETIANSELLSKLGECDFAVDIRVGAYASPDTHPMSREIIRMRLSRFVSEFITETDRFTGESPPYAGNIPVSPLLEDSLGIRPPSVYERAEYEQPVLWLGGEGCNTRLHKDGSKAFACHLFGSKRWTLFPPRDATRLNMYRVFDNSDYAVSDIDLNAIGPDRLPMNTASVSVTVTDNETLFIPEGWSHFVECLEPCLMITWFHKSDALREVLNEEELRTE